MKSLFFRVLALLLVSFLVVVSVSFLLFRWINEELEPGSERMRALVSETARELVVEHARGEGDEMRKRLRRRHVRAWIEDAGGQSLTGPGAPTEIRQQVTTFPQVIYPYQNPVGRFFILAESVNHDGDTYHVIMTSDRHGFRRRSRAGFFWLPIIAMLAGLIAGSAALSYWMLRPLRTFRETAVSISGDNLGARIPPKLAARRDAFGDLGREFNRMTDRLEQSVQNRDQLLRDVSHELRSPLARIQVAASLWGHSNADPESQQRIENEVERLDRLIGSLLSLSRLRGGASLSLKRFDLVPAIGEILEDANFEYSIAGTTAEVVAHETLPLEGDPSLILRALENVLRNAMRHSPEGGRVQVRLSQVGSDIEVTVSDEGPGVDAALLERIFEPFFRADTARGVGSGEHGIGLALTRAIVERHGGSITARNVSPHGLLVTIRLPAGGAARDMQ